MRKITSFFERTKEDSEQTKAGGTATDAASKQAKRVVDLESGKENSIVDNPADLEQGEPTSSSMTSKRPCFHIPVPVPAAAEPKPMEQFVPFQSFKFPKNESGRSCVRDWFSMYNWLHYDQSKDSVRCFTCIQASHLGRPGTTRGNEEAFINEGVRNWRKALEKLQKHDCSHFHRESADYVIQVLKRESVAVRLSTQLKQEQQSARIAMRTIISSIRYLTRSAQALQGSIADKANLMDLLHERALDCPDLANWIKRRDKWISHDIQDEIIQIMTHQVQRKLVFEIKSSLFFGLMADGTTDRTGNEQLSICFRYIESETLQPKEIFVVLYNTDDGTAKTLHKTVSDVMLRSSLLVQNLRGHCFDGAAAMSGHLNGLQKLLSDDQPKSIFVHCSNHSLVLVIQEVAKKCELISNSISLVKDVSNAILESSKRKTIFSDIVLDPCTESDNSSLKPKRSIALFPTRWCVQAKSIRRFVENYVRVQETLTIILTLQLKTATKAITQVKTVREYLCKRTRQSTQNIKGND